MEDMNAKLLTGFEYNGQYINELNLLHANGIAEEVYVNKISGKPFTWIAKVIAISVESIGGTPIAGPCREAFEKTGTFEIPSAVRQIALPDSNTLLVEVHRKCWENLLKGQEGMCKYCAKSFTADIDLNKIVPLEEDMDRLDVVWKTVQYDLKRPFEFKPIGKGENPKFVEYDGMPVNRFLFRVPTLGDAIAQEQYSDDTVKMWRRIAYNTLEAVQSVSLVKPEKEGAEPKESVIELDNSVKTFWGNKVFESMLDARDLKGIRVLLREEFPLLPFAYEDECPCPDKRTIPLTIEAGDFFSA